VILLDLRMPGATGIQAARRLRQQEYEGAIIVLTSYGDKAYVRQALEAGADSYLLKNTPSAELIESIRSAARGRRQLSPELLDSVLEAFGGLAREKTVRDADLSAEDLQMLTLASEGATNREIGVSLNRSEIAVKKRLQSVFQKLDVNDRAHAVAEALRRGLI
jgi:DNA-binding NarL/FixJ family response regulator